MAKHQSLLTPMKISKESLCPHSVQYKLKYVSDIFAHCDSQYIVMFWQQCCKKKQCLCLFTPSSLPGLKKGSDQDCLLSNVGFCYDFNITIWITFNTIGVLPSEHFLELIFSRLSQAEDSHNSCYTMGHTYRPGPETVLNIILQRHFNLWKNIYVRFSKVQVKGISILRFFKVTVLTKKSKYKTLLVLTREAEVGVLLGSVLPTVRHHAVRFL